MMAGRHGGVARVGRMLAALACIAGLNGCDLRPSAPESRAEYFVEKLIREPQALDDLRAVARLAEDENPDALATDTPTRAAITYLRARARLGAKLGFHVADSARLDAGHRRVSVDVSEGVTVGGAEAVRFQVDMAQSDGDWRVARLHAD